MAKPKYKLCRFCKWLVRVKGYTGFCEAKYETKNINSRGEYCNEYSYDPNDTFYYKGWKSKWN